MQSQFLALSRATVHPPYTRLVFDYTNTYLPFDNDRMLVSSWNCLVAAVSAAVLENAAPYRHRLSIPLVIKLMEIRLDAFMRFHLYVCICVRASLKHRNAIHSRFWGDKRKPRNSTTSCGAIITKWSSRWYLHWEKTK